MATQLLGANASLNAPGGKPGAAPTVLQGALVTSGNADVNGTLKVTQPLGGGVRTAYFTDGNTGAAENSFSIFTDQADTTLAVLDNGVQGDITFNGATVTQQAGTGAFNMTKPLRVAELLPQPTGVGAGTVSIGDVLNPSSLKVTQTNQAGAVIASFTDGNANPLLENTLNIFTSVASTTLQFIDNTRIGELSFEGALPPLVVGPNAGLFQFTRPVNIPSITTTLPTVVVPEGYSSGSFQIDAAGGGFGPITVPGVTATSVIMVTPLVNVGSFWVTGRNAGVFVVNWSNGAVSPSFMWHIVAY